MFDRLSKHLECCQKYSAARRILNFRLGIWISRWNTVSRVWYITCSGRIETIENLNLGTSHFKFREPKTITRSLIQMNCYTHAVKLTMELLPGGWSSFESIKELRFDIVQVSLSATRTFFSSAVCWKELCNASGICFVKALQAKGPVWTKRKFWSMYRIASLKEKSTDKNHVLIVSA